MSGPLARKQLAGVFGPRVRTTMTSIEFVGQPVFSEWCRVVAKLAALESVSSWWKGDVLLYGLVRWGRKWAEAEDLFQQPIPSLKVYQWVAEQFPPGRRERFRRLNCSLSFGHAMAVAGLKDADGDPDVAAQESWLDQAEADGWSVAQLREALRAARGAPANGGAVADLEQYRLSLTGSHARVERWRLTEERTGTSARDVAAEALDRWAALVLDGTDG